MNGRNILNSLSLSLSLSRKYNVFKDYNILRNEIFYNKLYHNGRPRPITIFIETINLCTNDCVICAHDKMTRKKQVMPMSLFESCIKQYEEMGGGYISLTPEIGEIFLDKFLYQRIKLLNSENSITGVFFTSNVTKLHHYKDGPLSDILNGIKRIRISVYGLDREEYFTMTRRDYYKDVVKNIQRIVSLIDDKEKIVISFRCLKKRTVDDMQQWIDDNFHTKLTFDWVEKYANWGNSLDNHQPLPFDGQWYEDRINTEQCLLPILAMLVFVNGDVSFCPCCDYDGNKELYIGNIKTDKLIDIYSSRKTCTLWKFNRRMPDICRQCTFHVPFSALENWKSVFEKPVYIG